MQNITFKSWRSVTVTPQRRAENNCAETYFDCVVGVAAIKSQSGENSFPIIHTIITAIYDVKLGIAKLKI